MANNEPIIIDSTSIKPQINENETQIILQRHGDYDRVAGGLMPESTAYQQIIAQSFVNELKSYLTDDELKNTYFLFDSSNTVSNGNFKRCVETSDIAMDIVSQFFEENNIPLSHVINLNGDLTYNRKVRENSHIAEPRMFTEHTGYFEYLKAKHNGINKDFWVDFESDTSKEKRLELNAEGPDEIVDRGVRYINVLQRYSKYFHSKFPNSRLIIWGGTHYDLISPLVKQKVLYYDKSDIVQVDYCGGISFLIDTSERITVNVNGITYPFDSQYNKPPRRHF